jgi:hypothetical protein
MGYSYSFLQKKIGDIRGNCLYIKTRGRSKEYFSKDQIKINVSMMTQLSSIGLNRLCILNTKTNETYLAEFDQFYNYGVVINAYSHLPIMYCKQSILEVEDA